MIKFNAANLSEKTPLTTELTAALSETELDFVTGGGGGMINPQPLPPSRHVGSTDPRCFQNQF
jgi:hypothetical protein